MAIFGPFIALDPAQSPMLSMGASGQVYATDDTALATPLPMTDLSGVTITEAVSDANGLVQGIDVADHTEVIWASGDYRVPVRSYAGVLDLATTAAADAVSAASSANASAASAELNRVPAGGTSGQVLAKASNTDNDVTWITQSGGGGGTGSGVLVLGAEDPVPPGTPAMSPIFRLTGAVPGTGEITMLTGAGNLTSAYGALTTNQSVAAPSNTAIGDLLIAIGWGQAAVEPFDWTQPAGWTSQFESTSGRRLMIATYPIWDAEAVTTVTTGTHNFAITGDTSNTRNGVMIFRVTGANLTTPVVGVSAYSEGISTAKTYPSFSASSPAIGELLVETTNLSSGATDPVPTYAAGYQAVNVVTALDTQVPPAKTLGTAIMYRVSGTTIPERVNTYSPGWSAGIAGLHIAIAGA